MKDRGEVRGARFEATAGMMLLVVLVAAVTFGLSVMQGRLIPRDLDPVAERLAVTQVARGFCSP